MFIVLLINVSNGCNHINCMLLSNQKCTIEPTAIDLHPNERNQEFHYYPFVTKLDTYFGSCNTLNNLSNKNCVPNKTEDLNLSMFNMVTGINE